MADGDGSAPSNVDAASDSTADTRDAGGAGGRPCGSGPASSGSDAGDADAGTLGGGAPFVLDRDQCARNWQIAYTLPAGATAPSRDLLRVNAGRIFMGGYASNGKSAIVSLTPGGTPKVLHEGPHTGIWLDGDNLVYSEEAALFTIPQGGGTPEPGVKYATNRFAPSPYYRALDAHFIYWFQHDSVAISAPYELWRLARNGGVEELLFSFTPEEMRVRPVSGTYVVGDQVLVYSQATNLNNAYAWSVSTTTNQRSVVPVLLPGPGESYAGYTTLLGVSDDGALLWTRPSQVLMDMGDRPYLSFTFALGSLSGAPVPFGVRLPPRAVPLAAWSAGSGAWYLLASEEPQMGHVMASVWWVDATGRASRLGCDPLDWFSPPFAGEDLRRANLISTAAATPAGLTFAIRYPTRPSTIVSVSNQNLPSVPTGCPADASPSGVSDGGSERPPSTCASDPSSECLPGTVQTQPCGSTVGACKAGTQSRTCTESCLWPAWSSCGGASYAAASAEVCGDGADNDCNGSTDEGCACKPVVPGAPRSFSVSGTIVKLMSHPSACLMFGLNAAAPSEMVVFDTAMKREVTRVALGGTATDFDLSPNGQRLVVALSGVKQVVAVDTGTFAVTNVPTPAVATTVEVDDAGNIYYADPASDFVHRMNLDAGSSSDVKLMTPYSYQDQALELSADGSLLYEGGNGSTASHLYSLNVSGADAVKVGQDNWDGGYGFSLPPRYVYLGPSGKNVYYAGVQLDATQLTFVRGPSGYVLAEDAAGSVAVSNVGVLDARLLTRLATFSAPVAAGALTASDHELWTFDQNAGVMTCANMADLVAGRTLGVRESAPGLLANHGFAKLVADPKRPRLYGLDTLKRVVVEIDPAAGVALRQVLIGSGSTDLAIDPTGTSLYVGHLDTQGIAQIDAESLTFNRFIPTRYVPFDVAPLGIDRIATMDWWQWTSPSLIDVATGSVLDFQFDTRYEGQLAATSDGKTLFVADNPGITNPAVFRYDVSAGKLQQVSKSGAGLTGGVASVRTLLVTPDGTSVYYAGQCLNGTDLTQIRYAQSDRILSIAPNSILAASSSRVYRVSDGVPLATVPGPCPVQTFSRDSTTLYCTDAGFLTSLDVRSLK